MNKKKNPFIYHPALDKKVTFFFFKGASYNTECEDIPLLPVVMVILGGTGILKCLSFLLQLLIIITVWRKQKGKGAEFMSETSGLDNTMNWTYVVVLLAGAPAYSPSSAFVTLLILLLLIVVWYTLVKGNAVYFL